MKKSTGYILVTIIIIILMISSFVVYANNSSKAPTLEEKVTDEIRYLSNYLVSLLGHFNGLTVGEQIFQVSQPKTQIGRQPEKNPLNTTSQDNGSQGEETNSEAGGNSGASGGNNQTGEAGTPTGQTGQEDNTKRTSQNGGISQSGNITQNGIFASQGNHEANWEMIQLHVEQMYQTWNTISLDLHSLNVEGNSILAFSDGLNNVTQNVKKKDKAKAIEEINKIYQLLPTYMEKCSQNSEQTRLLNLEVQVVGSYVSVTNGKWQEASEMLTQTEKEFANMLNQVDRAQKRQNQTTMNQCYILVNELRNAVNLKDKEIFFIQYQNFITKIGVIL